MAIKSYVLIELDGVRAKSFLRLLVFGHPYCLSSNNTEFNADHENRCPFPCHIGTFIPTFKDMYLHVIVRKKFYICISKFYLCICIPYICISNRQKTTATKISFSFNTSTAKLDVTVSLKKKKSCNIFSNYKFLVIKQLLISAHSTKLMILLLLSILL